MGGILIDFFLSLWLRIWRQAKHRTKFNPSWPTHGDIGASWVRPLVTGPIRDLTGKPVIRESLNENWASDWTARTAVREIIQNWWDGCADRLAQLLNDMPDRHPDHHPQVECRRLSGDGMSDLDTWAALAAIPVAVKLDPNESVPCRLIRGPSFTRPRYWCLGYVQSSPIKQKSREDDSQSHGLQAASVVDLLVVNYGVALDISQLSCLGHTTKKKTSGKTRFIGGKGEGLKRAFARLVATKKNRHEAEITTSGYRFVPNFAADSVMDNTNTLVLNRHATPQEERTGTAVMVTQLRRNCDWMPKDFLFLIPPRTSICVAPVAEPDQKSEPAECNCGMAGVHGLDSDVLAALDMKKGEVVAPTRFNVWDNALLLDSEDVGAIYVRGVFVRRNKGRLVGCGLNLNLGPEALDASRTLLHREQDVVTAALVLLWSVAILVPSSNRGSAASASVSAASSAASAAPEKGPRDWLLGELGRAHARTYDVQAAHELPDQVVSELVSAFAVTHKMDDATLEDTCIMADGGDRLADLATVHAMLGAQEKPLFVERALLESVLHRDPKRRIATSLPELKERRLKALDTQPPIVPSNKERVLEAINAALAIALPVESAALTVAWHPASSRGFGSKDVAYVQGRLLARCSLLDLKHVHLKYGAEDCQPLDPAPDGAAASESAASSSASSTWVDGSCTCCADVAATLFLRAFEEHNPSNGSSFRSVLRTVLTAQRKSKIIAPTAATAAPAAVSEPPSTLATGASAATRASSSSAGHDGSDRKYAKEDDSSEDSGGEDKSVLEEAADKAYRLYETLHAITRKHGKSDRKRHLTGQISGESEHATDAAAGPAKKRMRH